MTHFLFIGVPEISLVVITCIMVFCILLPIIALIDLVKSEFTGNNKLIWLLIIIFFNFFGAILYFIMASKQKVKMNNNSPSTNP